MNKEEETKKKVHFFRALLNAGFKDITNDIYPEKNYSEKELSCYTNIMKRAFKKGTYSINCDYGGAFIKVGESSEFKSFEDISDKLIALVIFLGGLKTENSRYKFGRYKFGRYKTQDTNDVYDAVMTSYPYDIMFKARKKAIEEARIQLPKILEEVRSLA